MPTTKLFFESERSEGRQRRWQEFPGQDIAVGRPFSGWFMISFPCGNCNKPLKVKDEFAGKKVKCPGCGQQVVIPTLVSAPPDLREGRTVPPSFSPGREERTLPPQNPG